ncbi:family 10 glycosylhydrolase [Rufibacter ruber]|uniref:family 10 glycosylhydrolase n=1 Tax=Rufibacter ruber TaxID=1783499 RepID=UPI00083597E4|nr:family 10 glycosylhydrolase [Rufibacter ruber]
MNLLVKRVHDTINDLKPWVKFGISPSGIYRNSTDPAIGTNTSGLQHYSALYADSRKWLQEGWIDYLAPQVYWYIGQPGANYGVVVPWWNNNAFGRHIYIGLAGYKVNDPAQGTSWADPQQIPNQVRMNRQLANVYGQAIYNTSSLRSSSKLGMRDSLRLFLYKKPALLPNMPWRDATPPAAPTALTAQRFDTDSVALSWAAPAAVANELDKVKQYAVYRSESPAIDLTTTDHLIAITNTSAVGFKDKVPDVTRNYYYAVTALDRFHNESTLSNITSSTLTASREESGVFSSALAAFPNPFFGERLTIRFSLWHTDPAAELAVYDLYGRKVQQVYSGRLEGQKEHQFDIATQPLQGRVFLIRLMTAGKVYTAKVIRGY